MTRYECGYTEHMWFPHCWFPCQTLLHLDKESWTYQQHGHNVNKQRPTCHWDRRQRDTGWSMANQKHKPWMFFGEYVDSRVHNILVRTLGQGLGTVRPYMVTPFWIVTKRLSYYGELLPICWLRSMRTDNIVHPRSRLPPENVSIYCLLLVKMTSNIWDLI